VPENTGTFTAIEGLLDMENTAIQTVGEGSVDVLDDSIELLESLIRLPEAEQDRERRIVRGCAGTSDMFSSRRFTI
jgi:hypothetical protein